MKNKVFALIGATAAFVSSGLITYKLLNRRRIYYSFWELYEDNAGALQRGDDLFE